MQNYEEIWKDAPGYEGRYQVSNLGKVKSLNYNRPVLPTVFSSIEEAVETLGLSKRVRWKNYLGYLCRYTKKDICPTFVIDNGLPVQINGG